MKAIFWAGLTVLIFGVISLVVPIRNTQRDRVAVGGITIGVETTHRETISPVISALLILAAGGMMMAGQWQKSMGAR